MAPKPLFLLLKTSQSEEPKEPVAVMEATGMLIMSELVEVEILKMLPAVPVETFWMMLLTVMLEEDRFLEASVTTKEEAERVAMLRLPKAVTLRMLAPVEVVRLKRLMEALEALPAMANWARGVEVLIPTFPPAVTVKYWAPVVEETTNIGSV